MKRQVRKKVAAPATITPRVRTIRVGALRSGRDAFLRSVRGKVSTLNYDPFMSAVVNYRKAVLDVLDTAIVRYKGE